MDVVNLIQLARDGTGNPVWTGRSDDLNLNLVVLRDSAVIAEHVNVEVDVLLMVVDGEGRVEIDGEEEPLRPGCLVVVPKGARRSIQCDGDRLAYLTCHKRRGGLWPEGIPRPGATR